jgi:hypothetical protein
MKQAGLALVVMSSVIGCGLGGEPKAKTPQLDMSLLRDRLWIDHKPTGPKDKVNVFVVLSKRPR